MLSDSFAPDIVRAYDIRGTYNHNLYNEDAWRLGGKLSIYLRAMYNTTNHAAHTQSLKKESWDFNFSITQQADPKPFVLGVARDGRHSSPALHHALCQSLRACGIHVVDLGVGPSPYAYFAYYNTAVDGVVMITASHNPKDDNGFKLLIYGKSLSVDDLQTLSSYPLPDCVKEAYRAGQDAQLTGDYHDYSNILQDYGAYVVGPAIDIKLPQKIVWDFANGAMCCLKPWIKKYIKTQHIFICDDLDPTFRSHEPDPTIPKNRAMIEHTLRQESCDIGFAFDGDGDRLVVIKNDGDAVDGDRLVAILARDVLKNNPGCVVLGDIKSSAVLCEAVEEMGGRPILTRTGHSFIKAKMKETGALLAGEMSGHIFFADENHGYDDGLYAACRVLRLLARAPKTLNQLDDDLPRYDATPEIKIEVDESQKFILIEKIKARLSHDGKKYNDLDGVRVDDDRGWWLVRASNTQAMLVIRMEGKSRELLNELKNECENYLNHVGVKTE